MSKKFEYELITMPALITSNYPDFEAVIKTLKYYGEAGWELVQILPDCRKMIFKKEIND